MEVERGKKRQKWAVKKPQKTQEKDRRSKKPNSPNSKKLKIKSKTKEAHNIPTYSKQK